MYTRKNYPTKKALREAFKAGDEIEVYQPGGMFEGPSNGEVTLEGPHYPEPHKWYARVRIEDRVVVKILS
jgi:hypothetical protein